ncbi:FemAB family XrtA/PEP-CTERM system-associated protein [Brumicola blandensis]|uniref:FemAB family PEP-CTERM system-associated protein n=1 Tax=Brumicola blandensis TaxID=3075611 RepID=A0AAW8R632_9ALTE|nr:FemAB family XrtA/PEP-CTERM system-associated protein [Alteromonas sp. W409]MDT0582643.1 FemAB family PEP-CTERM system-associated protein [Alteromonas sp. W409]
MIEIKRLNDTHQAIWDNYVDQCDAATPYHRFAWGQAVKASYGFDTHYLGAFEGDKLVGVLPLIEMKTPLKGSSYVAAPYCDAAGPLAENQSVVDALRTAAVNVSTDTNSPLEIRNASNVVIAPEKLIGSEKVRMLLNLEADAEQQMAAFKSKLRSQIRKAEKNGLNAGVFRFESSAKFEEKLAQFYEVISLNMRSLGSPVHSKEWFKQVLKNYQDKAYLALVYSDDVTVGGGIVLLNGNAASIPWASTKSDYNRLAPNMLLYWTVISEAIKSGASTFDFGRSTAFEGTYNFKKQWGASPSPLDWQSYKDGTEQPESAESKNGKLRQLVEAIWKKLPLGLVNALGPKIRKYVSL